MKDYRTEDQKLAAVAASLTMAGQPVTPEVEAVGRRILRGEISADQAVLDAMVRRGHGSSERAQVLRCRIAASE